MVRFISTSFTKDNLGTTSFKFHYGKIHIRLSYFARSFDTAFKFHYGKIRMMKTPLGFVLGTSFKFHYGKIHIVPFGSLCLCGPPLNSTMVRFILPQ